MRSLALLLTAYFFLLGLFPQLDGSQFARIGQLWEHFAEHRSERLTAGEELPFLDFLYAHYLSPEQHDHPDRSQHEQLPFQHLGSAPVITCVAVVVFADATPVLSHETTEVGYRNVFFPVEFVIAISHPPSLG